MAKSYENILEELVTNNRKKIIESVLNKRTRFISVMLENIYQSHNINAVMRTCDNLGIQDIYSLKSDKIKKSGKNVSLGAEKWLTVKTKPRNQKVNDYLSNIKRQEYKVIGTVPKNTNTTTEVSKIKFDKKIIVAFGNEEKGLSNELLKNCDEIISIPMYGFTESYNISVSCAIILSNMMFRLRETKKKIALNSTEKELLRLEWIKKSIKNVNLILKNINK
jgi:tRNA (guanosine-2'-O-)-methyltransferase|tara:strand:+ start:280 stop:942 length:663 start_codon:yes stop_codon:yes gene_type:complete